MAAAVSTIHQTGLGSGANLVQKALGSPITDVNCIFLPEPALQNTLGGTLQFRNGVDSPGGAAPAGSTADDAVPATAAHGFPVQFT